MLSLGAVEPLLRLAAIFEADASLIEELELVLRQPAAYLERFAERLDNRGITSVRPDLGWFALIDGLIARQRAWELDWKSSPREVSSGLEAIHPGARDALGASFLSDCDALPREPQGMGMAHEYLQLAGGRLLERGLALAQLAIASDSHPVVVFPAEHLPGAVELAGQVPGEGLVHLKP